MSPTIEVDADPGQVVGKIPIQQPALLQQQVRRIPALENDLIDDVDRIKRAHQDRPELRGGVEERVDDESVIEPQLQRAAKDDRERDDPLSSRDEGILDLAR